MAARRKTKRVARGKNGTAVRWGVPAEAPAVPEADFLPPGFSTDEAVAGGKANGQTGEVVTYFLHTGKRGLSRYLPMALKHFYKGFRGILVANGPLVFEQSHTRVVGKLTGDHFELAVKWAKRTIVKELNTQYILSGGGTPRERERTVRRFLRAMEKVKEVSEKVKVADGELEQASIEMVLRFGSQSFDLGGVTLDVCSGPGDKVFWRSRNGKLPELG